MIEVDGRWVQIDTTGLLYAIKVDDDSAPAARRFQIVLGYEGKEWDLEFSDKAVRDEIYEMVLAEKDQSV